MSLVLREVDGLVQFAVKAVPGASRDRIVGLLGDALKVQVSAAPEGGKANDRLCEVLAERLAVPKHAVQVVAGHGNPRKVVAVRGLSVDAVRAALGG